MPTSDAATTDAATSVLLLLADGRLPTGGHVHSGGVEEAVNDGRITGIDDLRPYLTGRLATAGLVDAALAVAVLAVADRGIEGPVAGGWRILDAEAAARCAVPALRAVARSQGRGLVRAAGRMWPEEGDLAVAAGLHPGGPMWPVALGVVARVAGVGPAGAALVAAQASISGPAWAAVRLLGLDPFSVAALLAELAPAVEAVAAAAAASVAAAATVTATGAVGLDGFSPDRLPAAGGPLGDVAAMTHAAREVRLFAS
jgi:urease accessory protein